MDGKVRAFLHRIAEDERLKERVEGVKAESAEESAQALSDIARAEGFDLSPEDLLSIGKPEDGELDEAELTQVSGGGSACWCVALGIGDAHCLCIAAGGGELG